MKIFISLDWDYFIKATAEDRASLFPDGGIENLPESVKSVIWDSHYSGKSALKKVRTVSELTDIKKYIAGNKFEEALVVESHRYMYDFVMRSTDEDSVFKVINVDFHHDYYQFGEEDEFEEVNCGNWVIKLLKKYKNMKYTWVCREDSDLDTDFEIPECVSIETDLNKVLSEISKEDELYIFLCRSDMWSPPHLDSKFTALAEAIENRSLNFFYEKAALCSRKFQLSSFKR